jgi:hypothetical protein
LEIPASFAAIPMGANFSLVFFNSLYSIANSIRGWRIIAAATARIAPHYSRRRQPHAFYNAKPLNNFFGVFTACRHKTALPAQPPRQRELIQPYQPY